MYFDKQAQDWDNKPKKVERAKLFAGEIINFIKPNQMTHALEFGCGTGLLSFHLKDYFKTITLADNSKEMMKVLKEKIKANEIKNFLPINIDLLESSLESSKFDVIYTLMTLHHIPNVNKIIGVLNSLLKTDGYLCIADLVQEDGSFHLNQEDFDGHNGFDKNKLSTILSDNGFSVEKYKIFFELDREVDNKIRKYPMFLMICKKTN